MINQNQHSNLITSNSSTIIICKVSLQKLKPIQGSGTGGSIISQGNNGMSYLGQMDSSNSSTSNLYQPKLNLSPQHPSQLQNSKSGRILHKSGSSPMNSFINKSSSRPQFGNNTGSGNIVHLNVQAMINTMSHANQNLMQPNIYNSQQPPFRGGDTTGQDIDITPSSIAGGHTIDKSNRFIYKSNSQRSINWEGTPQNHTNKSINNKNSGSQSHQSLLGSQGKNHMQMHTTSSKKMLMPSGSSGTLLRKESNHNQNPLFNLVIEMDEVNSSSSSSIGREENANQAFNGSNRMKKIGKLNFTGKPFAPDSIFINNIGKNLGDEDEGGDFDNMYFYFIGFKLLFSENVQLKNQDLKLQVSQSQLNQSKPKNPSQFSLKNYHTTSSNSTQQTSSQQQINNNNNNNNNKKSSQTNNYDYKPNNQGKVFENQLQLVIEEKDKINNKKQKKQNISGVRNLSPSEQKKLSQQNQFKQKVITYAQPQVNVNTGRLSLNPQSTTNIQSDPSHQQKPKVQVKAQKLSNQPQTQKKQQQFNGNNLTQGGTNVVINLSDLNKNSNAMYGQQNHTLLTAIKQEIAGNNDSQNLNYKRQLSQTQKIKISFVDQTSSTNLAHLNNHTDVKLENSMLNNSQAAKSNQTTLSSKQSYQNNNSNHNKSVKNQVKTQGQTNLSQQIYQSSQYVSNYAFLGSAQGNSLGTQGPQYSSKSPAEKMIESSLLHSGINNNLLTPAQNSKKNKPDLKIISSVQSHFIAQPSVSSSSHASNVQTPSRQSQQISSRKYTNNSSGSGTQANKSSNSSSQYSKPKSNNVSTINQQPMSDRKLIQQKTKSNKVTSYDFGGVPLTEVASPSQFKKLQQNQGSIKMKGDVNNFNEMSISINDGDTQKAIIEGQENEENDDEGEDQYNFSITKNINGKGNSNKNRLIIEQNKLASENSSCDKLSQMFQKLDQNKLSPSKSNKVPSSLAFKRRSDDQQQFNFQELSLAENQTKRFTLLNDKQTSLKSNTLDIEDEQTFMVMSARPQYGSGSKNAAMNEVQMFTLKDKQELKRNIPQFHNLNFGGNNSIISGHVRQTSDLRSKKSSGQDVVTNSQILGNLVQFFDFEILMKLISIIKKFREDFTKKPTAYQIEIFKIFKSQLRIILITGLPSTLQRILYWNFKTKFFYGKKKKPNLFKTLKRLKLDDNAAAEIKKDVHRTFPDMKFFQMPQKGQLKLFNILNAVANKNIKTGYIQGMNFLAGTILINLQKGEESFWMMMSILNKYKFDSILDLKNGGLFQILCFQLEIFIDAYIPDLYQHFKLLKIPTDIYAANWFITMFCSELSLDLVFCILDVFLLEGIKSLIRVALALLKVLKDDLLSKNFEECMVYLSHGQKDISLDSQTLMETAFSFRISNTLLLDLELFYKLKNRKKGHHVSGNGQHTEIIKVFHKLKLQEEDHINKNKNKQYWIIEKPTTEDIKEALRHDRNLREEHIQIFYKQNIKGRKLRDIVEEMQTDEDSEIANVNSYAIEKKDIQNAKMIQPSRRKKETLHSKYAQSAATKNRKKQGQLLHFNTDSNNTIQEMTNDYSKGGSGKNQKNQNKNGSNFTNHNISQDNSIIVTRFIQEPTQQLSQVIKDSSTLITPRRQIQKIDLSNEMGNDMTQNKIHQTEFQQNRKISEQESPFVQIGSKIKSIFGNFFKTQDKLNKSYEDLQNDNSIKNINDQVILQAAYNNQTSFTKVTKQARSKSIHQSALHPTSNIRESSDIRMTTQTYNSNQTYQKYPFISNQPYLNQQPPKEYFQEEPNSFFKKTSNNQLYYQVNSHNNEVHNLQGLRLNKQISKSLERGANSEIDSMIYGEEEENEECEVDLLSSSADYAIGTVGDNVQLKRHQEFSGASKRPEILIAKDLIAGDEEDYEDSLNDQNHLISQANKNGPRGNFGPSSLMSQTFKAGQLHTQGLQFNMKKSQMASNYNSNRVDNNNNQNQKIMKSSPPVSPKERLSLVPQSKGQIIKSAVVNNKRR